MHKLTDGTQYRETAAGLIASAPDLLAALQESTTALENLRAYIVKHQDRLPPVSTTGTEVRIAHNRAAIARATGERK